MNGYQIQVLPVNKKNMNHTTKETEKQHLDRINREIKLTLYDLTKEEPEEEIQTKMKTQIIN